MDMLDPMMPPDLVGDVLGLGPDPRLTPPPKPDLTRKPDKTRDLVRLALTGLALGLGPGRGTGLAAGLSMADQQYRQDQRLREQDALRQYQTTYNDWQQQARTYQQEADRRGQMLVKTLDNLAADIEGTRSSEDAERVYQMYGQALTAYGFRGYDAESLKRKIKSPDRKARAMKAVDAFLKNPAFKSAYEQDPESVSQATVEVDGVPVTLAEAMQIAGSGMVGKDGRTITPRTTPKADTRSLQVQAADALARGDNAAYQRLLQVDKDFQLSGQRPASGGANRSDPRVDRLGQRFGNEQIVKDFNVIATKSESLRQILSGAQSGPGDIAVVYEFMKALDPSSVVRETEYATAARSGNIFTGAFAKFNGAFNPNGGFLSPQVKQEFMRLVNTKLSAQRRAYDNLASEYGRQIERITGEPGTGKDYLIDYGKAFPAFEEPAPAGDTNAARERARQKYKQRQGVK